MFFLSFQRNRSGRPFLRRGRQAGDKACVSFNRCIRQRVPGLPPKPSDFGYRQRRKMREIAATSSMAELYAQAQILDLEIIFDALFRALAALAGLFDAAEGGDFGRDEAGIDADHAIFQRFGDPENLRHVHRVEIGS